MSFKVGDIVAWGPCGSYHENRWKITKEGGSTLQIVNIEDKAVRHVFPKGLTALEAATPEYPPAPFKVGMKVKYSDGSVYVVAAKEGHSRADRIGPACPDALLFEETGYVTWDSAGLKKAKPIIEEVTNLYPPPGWNVGDLVDEDNWIVVSEQEARDSGMPKPDTSNGKTLLIRQFYGGKAQGSAIHSGLGTNPVSTPVKAEPVLGGWVTPQEDDPNVEVARFEGDSGWRA